MEDDASFGHWLSLRRQSLGLQRTELAARAGCAVVTLRKIEADERRPSRELAEQLAKHLSIAAYERVTFIRVARGELLVERLPRPQLHAAQLTNLPIPTTTFVGREREVVDICARLARPDVRLLTLTGAPGVGKTRLALEVASELRGVFADGIFLIDLSPLQDPALVLDTVAQTMRVTSAGGPSLVERLGGYVRSKQLLLVFDNFEHVLEAALQLSQLLAAAPQLKLLVTSRVALELAGEHRFSVLPLLVPPAEDNMRLAPPVAGAPTHYPAVDLFVQRAHAVMPTFAVTKANMPVVGEICRRLDGLPLAIELAAARVTLFTPQELLARLDDRFTLLTGYARDLPPRHITLRHAIDLSYNQLDPVNQLLFRRWGVFVGGCTVEAAQEVCNADGALGRDIVEGIAVLVAGSLLQRREGRDGRSRFAMLETVREYTLSQLVASGEAERIQQLHTAYYVGLAEAAERVWDKPDEPAQLRRLVSVRDNLRTVLRRALEAGDVATLLRLNAALFSFWTACSPLGEARSWLERALTPPQPRQDRALVAAEARVLNALGYIAAHTSDFDQAYAYFERGMALYQALENSQGIAWSMRGCAVVEMLRSEYAAAEQWLNESLRICHSDGDAWGVAWSQHALAFVRLAEGSLTQAQPALKDVLVQMRQQGIIIGVIRTLFSLGYTLFEQSDVSRSEALYREGVALSQEMPLLTIITWGLVGLGMAAAATARPLRAARLWGAVEALREVSDELVVPVYQGAYARMLAAARTQVSDSEWAAAWIGGRALTAEQAVAEALEDASTRQFS
jgi:predicted ATPase/transcriptional regulator with XRE-family HTH domain